METVDTEHSHIDALRGILIQLLDLLSAALRGSELTSFISLFMLAAVRKDVKP